MFLRVQDSHGRKSSSVQDEAPARHYSMPCAQIQVEMLTCRVQDPSKLTVTICGHYDVADVSTEDGWRTPPFELTAADGNLYGRGVSTSKGPLVAALFAVKVS